VSQKKRTRLLESGGPIVAVFAATVVVVVVVVVNVARKMDKDKLKAKVARLRREIEDVRSRRRDGAFTAAPKSSVDIRQRKLLRGHFGKVFALQWGGPGAVHELVSASQDGKVILWDAPSARKKQAITLRSSWVMALGIEQHHNEIIASGGLDNTCTIQSLQRNMLPSPDFTCLNELVGHDGYISSCNFLNSKQLITSSGDFTCKLWDVNRGVSLVTFKGHTADAMAVAKSPKDRHQFVSGSCDATCKLWDTRSKNCIMTFTGHESDVDAVSFFPDGNSFGTASDDGSCRFFDIRSMQEMNSFSNEKILIGASSVAFSLSGRLLFAGYDDYKIRVWDTLSQENSDPVNTQPMSSDNRVSCLGVALDGSALVGGSWDHNLRVYA